MIQGTDKKYLLHPGYIMTEDGYEHFINASDLAEQHGITLAECQIYGVRDQYYCDIRNLVHLYPKKQGAFRHAHTIP